MDTLPRGPYSVLAVETEDTPYSIAVSDLKSTLREP